MSTALTINRKMLFDGAKKQKLFTAYDAQQVAAIDMLCSVFDKAQIKDIRWIAYMFATVYHETGLVRNKVMYRSMMPIEEVGKGKGRAYGKPHPVTGLVYYGRGYVQLTWYDNYRVMAALLKVDLVRHPELALQADIAGQIMIEGMTTALSLRGDFTGKSLENYFTATKEDPVNARRIINGTDKAELIAGYYRQFKACLTFN